MNRYAWVHGQALPSLSSRTQMASSGGRRQGVIVSGPHPACLYSRCP